MKMGKKKKQISIIRFKLDTVDISDNRYPSVDDWFDPVIWTEELRFKTQTADLGNWKYNALILIHALIEQILCYANGITDEQVTEFDTGEGKRLNNPGDSDQAPYHKEHMVANDIESILSVALKVNWDDYEKKQSKIVKKWKPKK